jgi:hypothetical protein
MGRAKKRILYKKRYLQTVDPKKKGGHFVESFCGDT